MKKTMLCLSLFSLLIATSCEKDPEDMVKKEDVIGSYILEEITEKIGTAEEVDATAEYTEECERDDVITFKTDMTMEVTDAGIPCPQPETGTTNWDLINGNKLVIELDTYDVVKWDSKHLHYSTAETRNGQRVIVTYKLIKQ